MGKGIGLPVHFFMIDQVRNVKARQSASHQQCILVTKFGPLSIEAIAPIRPSRKSTFRVTEQDHENLGDIGIQSNIAACIWEMDLVMHWGEEKRRPGALLP